MDVIPSHFDEETWDQLPAFLEHLPERVRLYVWADPKAATVELEAVRLVDSLGDRFDKIDYRVLPRMSGYPYHPFFAVLALDQEQTLDYGLRLIGLPAGYQMTSLIAAIQCVAFRGMTSDARTRIQLQRLDTAVQMELLTTAEDEAGTVMAQILFNMAVISPFIQTSLIMADMFPGAIVRYSVQNVPHIVINKRIHLEGLVEEATLLEHIAAAVKK